MNDTTKKPLILTWWPIIVVAIMIAGTSSVDAYRLAQLEQGASGKVNVDTYKIELAEIKSDAGANASEINKIKALQQQQNDVRIRQEAIRDQIRETKDDVKALNEKMDDKFDDLKDFIRGNQP